MKKIFNTLQTLLILTFLLGGCAPLAINRTRTAAQLMPEIKGQLYILRSRNEKNVLQEIPEASINKLKALLEELKRSPFQRYTNDPKVWENHITQTLLKVSELETAWQTGQKEKIKEALLQIESSRDESHKALHIY